MALSIKEKLAILADAAKYDASCASSGSSRPAATEKGKGLGASNGHGICHSFTPDGRCVSLLKLLLTNYCIYDCQYCVNRNSSNVQRARFSVEEVVQLTLDFYKRNYIEGLFLSSGIIQSPDHTMEEMARVAKSLRIDHGFRGYIHLKTIPDADQRLIDEAGRYADRLSINVELPNEQSLNRLAPEKDVISIRKSMGAVKLKIDERREEKSRFAPRYVPAGQTTQMIIGADSTTDQGIINASTMLYQSYGLRRVYYSAFSPIPTASANLPVQAPPLAREHRLYQADWLVRFYGFAPTEITTGADGMLSLDHDPKTAWALNNRGTFPVDINKAPKEMLLRVPGLGVKNVTRILNLRRVRSVRLEDLARLKISMKKVTPFIITSDHRPTLLDSNNLAQRLAPKPKQLQLL